VVNILVSGSEDLETDLAPWNGLMVLCFKVNGCRVKLKVMDDLYMLMVINTLDCGEMIKLMVGEFIISKMKTEKGQF
jgi:uncharacterized membrane protein